MNFVIDVESSCGRRFQQHNFLMALVIAQQQHRCDIPPRLREAAAARPTTRFSAVSTCASAAPRLNAISSAPSLESRAALLGAESKRARRSLSSSR